MSLRRAFKTAAVSLSLALLILTFSADAAVLAFRNVAEGQPAPNFTLKDAAGNDVSLSGSAGKTVVVIFFKPDQKSSQEALSDLAKIYGRYKNRGVEILSIMSEAGEQSELKALMEKEKIMFPVLIDEGRKIYGEWGAFLYPTTAIIDKDGKVSMHIPSHNRKYAEVVEGGIRVALGEITKEKLEEELNPKEVKQLTPEQKKAERHMMLGQKLMERKLVDKASAEFALAVEADPNLAEAKVLYGFTLLKLGDAAKAQDNFTKALAINPKVDDVKCGLGASYVALGEVDKGIEVLEDALKVNPKPARTHFELAKAYEKKGALDKATEHYKKALEEMSGGNW